MNVSEASGQDKAGGSAPPPELAVSARSVSHAPVPRFLAARWIILVIALAVALHLPAHLGRGDLPGDGPVLTANPAVGDGSVRGMIRGLDKAFTEPAGAWASATGAVGRARYRPLATAVFVVERWAFGSFAARGAALVSLALHILLALLAAALVGRLRGPPAARVLAAVLVAACPAALAVAAWPAQQSAVLAAVLGAGGLLLCLDPRRSRVLAGGLLLALAALCHEFAFGLPLAVVALRPLSLTLSREPDEAVAPRAGLLPLAVPVLAALGLWIWGRTLQSVPDVVKVQGPTELPLLERLFVAVFDGVAGAGQTLLALVWPARLHFADGAWQPGLMGRALTLALLFASVPFILRRLAHPAARTGLALLCCLAAIPLVRFAGCATYHDSYLYVALPLLVATLTLTLSALVRSGGRARTVAIASAALLVGAFVVGTLTRAAAFRDRDGLVELALSESGAGPLARSWQLAQALGALPQEPLERAAAVLELAPLAEGIASDVAPANLGSQVGDGVVSSAHGTDAEVATYIGEPLMAYAQALSEADVEDADPALEGALEIARTVTSLLPHESPAWSSLAAMRTRVGDVSGALDAVTKAYLLDPHDRNAAWILARVYMDLGSPADAVLILDRVHDDALDAARTVEPELALFLSSALIGDGRTLERIGGRTQHRFERALELLRPLADDARFALRAKGLQYEAGLHYGDFLASQDVPQLAILAYQHALAAGGAQGAAQVHFQWLRDRLAREEQEAREAVARAERGLGNVADALAQLAIAFCRQRDFRQADEVFTKLSDPHGGMSPALRLLFAKHRFGWSPEPGYVQRTITLLEEVLNTNPDLHEAEYELAHAFERSGRHELALDRFRTVARRAYLMEIGLEASEHARRLEFLLNVR